MLMYDILPPLFFPLPGHCISVFCYFAPQVEWLKERVDNLRRELMVSRKASGRLAKQLKVRMGGVLWLFCFSVILKFQCQ